MADTDTDTQIPNTADAIADLQRQLAQPPPAIPTGSPNDDTSPSWTGLLGRVLGGAPAGYQLRGGEADAAGNRALLNFGINMLLASGPHTVRPNVLSSLATGLQGAQESVGQDQRSSAALAGAQYQAAREARQDQLARIKEAIPLLQMQVNQRAVAGVPYTVGGGGKPGTPAPGTSIATGGSIAVPSEYLPFYQEASARTGIPAEVLIAQHQQESGFNPGATGAAGEIGVGQIAPKTATDPGYGMTGLRNPDVLRDPRTNINFAADYLAARAKAAGADFSTPEGTAKALKAYNGGGDPNYVANVTRYIPGARDALAPKAPPGQASAPAMAPVSTQPPNTRVQIPQAALPAPVQTAGPGAPTALAAPGQTTIEPETGAPVVMPSTPGSGPPVFRYTPSQIPPGLIPSGTFTPEQQQAVKTIQDAYVHERQVALTPADVQKAESNFGTNMTKVLGSQTDAAKVATDAMLKFHEADFKQQQDTHAKMLDDYLKQQQADQQQKNELARIAATANEARSTNREQVQNDASRKLVEDNNTETTAARGRVASLEALLELSRNAPDPTLLANKTIGGTPIVDLIKVFGVGGESLQNKASAIQALRSGIANVTKTLRQGVALGNASDADLRFIQAMGPNEMEDNATREAIIGNLLGQQYRQIRFNSEVNKLVSNGVKPGDAMDKANEIVPPVTPVLPKELQNAPRGDAKVAEWFSTNVPANTIWSDANGKRHILHTPDWKPPTAP